MVILYTQPTCAPCRVVESRLTKAGIPFEKIDITQDPEVADYLKAQGFIGTPVIDPGDGKLTHIGGLRDILEAHKPGV